MSWGLISPPALPLEQRFQVFETRLDAIDAASDPIGMSHYCHHRVIHAYMKRPRLCPAASLWPFDMDDCLCGFHLAPTFCVR
jgi:hypothetical protein